MISCCEGEDIERPVAIVNCGEATYHICARFLNEDCWLFGPHILMLGWDEDIRLKGMFRPKATYKVELLVCLRAVHIGKSLIKLVK